MFPCCLCSIFSSLMQYDLLSLFCFLLLQLSEYFTEIFIKLTFISTYGDLFCACFFLLMISLKVSNKYMFVFLIKNIEMDSYVLFYKINIGILILAYQQISVKFFCVAISCVHDTLRSSSRTGRDDLIYTECNCTVTLL